MLNLLMHHILKREFWKADVARILEGIAAVPVAAANACLSYNIY